MILSFGSSLNILFLYIKKIIREWLYFLQGDQALTHFIHLQNFSLESCNGLWLSYEVYCLVLDNIWNFSFSVSDLRIYYIEWIVTFQLYAPSGVDFLF